LNGTAVGSNSMIYTNSSLANGDVVSAGVTSNAVCATITNAVSNNISLTVTSSTVPMAFISVPSTIFCPGSSVTFSSNVTNGGPSPIYDWYLNGVSTGITTSTYTNSTLANGDVVMLLMTSSSACAAIPTVASNSITMFNNSTTTPSVSISSLSGNLCEGQQLNIVAIPVNATGILNYQWSLNGSSVGLNNNIYSSTSLVAGDQIGLTLAYQDACGNNLSVNSNTLIIVPTPLVSAGSDITLMNGVPVVLNGSSNVLGTILWTPSSTLSNATILNPSADPLSTTEYLLTVQTSNGCVGSDAVIVTIDNKEFEIFSSFTPNADGTNDTWVIPNSDFYPEISVQIFNKWGNLLYEQTNIYVPWDGTENGSKLPSDTYFYIIKLTPDADALKGPVTIVR